MSSYAIDGGRAGFDRLRLLAEVMRPATEALLYRAGLRPGMSCLDLGCGGGHVTRYLARSVGESGSAVGIDADPDILVLAKAETDGISNIEFRAGDARDGLGVGQYDLVYARFLLSHISEPERCIGAMTRACRAGGIVVVEDTHFAGSFCHPPSPAYDRYVDLYQQVVRRRGGDPNIGPKVPGLLREAGVEDIGIHVAQPTHVDSRCKFMSAATMERIAASVIADGLAAEAEVDLIIAGLREGAEDPGTIMSLPRVVQVWGRRP